MCFAATLSCNARSHPLDVSSLPLSSALAASSRPVQLGVDSFVFFANIRPAYKWASFGDCVVYSFTRPDKAEQCVVFWNIKTDER